jgi:hypothetical protein
MAGRSIPVPQSMGSMETFSLAAHPGDVESFIADAEIIYDILQRRHDFRRNMEEFAVLNVYGKRLSTTDDQEWQRHRKMTAVTFIEKNNELVWQKTIVQAKGALKYWKKRAQQPIWTTHNNAEVFKLNVLAAALFSRDYVFEGHAEKRLEEHRDEKSYECRDSLSTILEFIIQIFIFC